MPRPAWTAILAAVTMAAATACGPGRPAGPAPDLGGETTRGDATLNAFGFPAPKLTNEERRLFERGDSLFTRNWVTAPASTDARDGLGPTFNAQSCSSCHLRDGRGAPPDPAGEAARLGLLARLSVTGADPVTGGPVPDPNYGGQLQDRAVLGVEPEGALEIDYETIEGAYGDGSAYELVAPTYRVVNPAFGPLAPDVMIGPRLAPQIVGMGLLEAIPAEDILAAADPDDADGDGISGRANIVWDARAGETALGRFGWKANVATVEQQTAGAFHGDIGITSGLHPDQNCPPSQTACSQAPGGGRPELPDTRLGTVTLYTKTLAVPAMRGGDDADVRAGWELFEQIGCTSCHTPTHRTGDADIAALARQTIHPYTDLLLHDMGEALADGRPDFAASGREWRTPPLWGLGLIEVVNGARFLLHDGRARTLEEAILWHGGEGEPAREAFRLLPADDRRKLVAFLEAL